MSTLTIIKQTADDKYIRDIALLEETLNTGDFSKVRNIVSILSEEESGMQAILATLMHQQASIDDLNSKLLKSSTSLLKYIKKETENERSNKNKAILRKSRKTVE